MAKIFYLFFVFPLSNNFFLVRRILSAFPSAKRSIYRTLQKCYTSGINFYKAHCMDSNEKDNIFTDQVDYENATDSSVWGEEDQLTTNLLNTTKITGKWVNLCAGDGRSNNLLLSKADHVVAVDMDFATDIRRTYADGSLWIVESEPNYTLAEALQFLTEVFANYQIKFFTDTVAPEKVTLIDKEYFFSSNLILLEASKNNI